MEVDQPVEKVDDNSRKRHLANACEQDGREPSAAPCDR